MGEHAKALGFLIFGLVTGAVTAAMIFTFFVRSPPLLSGRLAAPAPHALKSTRAMKRAPREVASLKPSATIESPPLAKKVARVRHPASVAAITPQLPTAMLPTAMLPAPTFTATFPEHLETNSATEIRIAWNKVEGAKAYFLLIEDAQGNMIKKYSTTRTDTTVQIPAPENGEGKSYRLRVVAVNQNDLEGATGEPRQMHVQRRNSALAPSLKQITIEE